MSLKSGKIMFPNYEKAFEQAKKIEEADAHFKNVIGVSPADVLAFYCQTGDLPTHEQIQFIKIHGIYNILKAL